MTTRRLDLTSDMQLKPSELTEMGLTFLSVARNQLEAEVNQIEDDVQWNKLDRNLNKIDQAIEAISNIPTALREESF